MTKDEAVTHLFGIVLHAVLAVCIVAILAEALAMWSRWRLRRKAPHHLDPVSLDTMRRIARREQYDIFRGCAHRHLPRERNVLPPLPPEAA